MAMMAKRMWLLVEDDESIRVMMEVMVSTLWDDLDFQTFKDGYEAMAWLDKVEASEGEMPLPELILLDVRMPGPQGPEIGQRLRGLAATVDIPIIIMTAYVFSPEERKRIELMAKPNEFVHKSGLDIDEFKTLIDRTLATAR